MTCVSSSARVAYMNQYVILSGVQFHFPSLVQENCSWAVERKLANVAYPVVHVKFTESDYLVRQLNEGSSESLAFSLATHFLPTWGSTYVTSSLSFLI